MFHLLDIPMAWELVIEWMVVSTLAVIMRFHWSKIHNFLFKPWQKKKNTKAPIQTFANNTVTVSIQNIEDIVLRRQDDWDDAAEAYNSVRMPMAVEMCIYPLNYRDLQKLYFAAVHAGLDTQLGKCYRRGLTIASAVYKFSILKQFMLLDPATQRYLHAFRYDAKKVHYDEWVTNTGPEIMGSYRQMARHLEREHALSELDFQFTLESLLPACASTLLMISNASMFCTHDKLIRTIISDPSTPVGHIVEPERMRYLVECSLAAIIITLKIPAPVHYLHVSPFIDRLVDCLNNNEEQYTELRMVVNNEPYTVKSKL